jgi:hypothetical protein
VLCFIMHRYDVKGVIIWRKHKTYG